MATIQKMLYDPYHGSVSDKVNIVSMTPVQDEYGNIKYIVYLLRKTLNDNSVVEFYKAVSFFKLQRVAKESKENKKFMEIHTDIVRAMYSANIAFVEIIANILKPNPYGLIFLYGVQATGSSIVEATRKCDGNFQALLKSFQGTHRTAHVGPVSREEMAWIFEKISNQQYVAVLKGIPARRNGNGDAKSLIKAETSTEEQVEQFIVGLEGTEYCLMLMAQPISKNYLTHWLTKSLNRESIWQGQKQGTNSLGLNVGIPMSISMNSSSGSNISRNSGVSENKGINESQSTGKSTNETASESGNKTWSINHNESDGTNTNISDGTNKGQNENHGSSDSVGGGLSAGGTVAQLVNIQGSFNYNHSWNNSIGTNSGESHNFSSGENHNVSDGNSLGGSDGWSNAKSTGTTENTTLGTNESKGNSNGYASGVHNTTGTGVSTGLNIGASLSKTYQWVDKTVEYICELLTLQNTRLKSMVDGDGGFFVDMYISTEDETTQKAVEAVSATTWINPDSKIDVLRTEIPSRPDQEKLAMHMQAMSPCMEIVKEPGGSGYYYKYSSILCSSEVASYCHPPRVTIGGIDNSMEDVPTLRVPTDRQDKEIFIGHVMTGTRFSYEQACKHGGVGYMTDYKFSIGNNELHHAFISGQSRSGKSVLASRAVLECYKNAPYISPITGEKKRKRIFVLDPKGEWRQMANLIPKGKFRFYSLGKTNYHPLKMNLLRVPKFVTPYNYFNLVVEHFCSAYGLLDRAIAQIGSVIYKLYEDNDVFGHDDDPYWANEKSKDITLVDVYKKLEQQLHEAESRRNNHDAEALQTYLTRLDMYQRPHSNECIMFCNKGGDSADILLGEDDFTVIESNGLSKKSTQFFFILFMNSVYESALARGPKGFYTDSYETMIVLEEANSILISAGKEDTSGQQSIQRFNEILDKSASLGLFIWTITQKIASMPNSVIANSGIVFVGRDAQEDDSRVIMSALGFDERFNVEMKRFIPRLTTGCFIAKVSKGMKFEDQTPCVIRSAMLKTSIPDDKELDVILKEHDLERELQIPLE